MKKIVAVLATFTLSLVLFFSCEKESIVSVNKFPVANAGSDQVIVLPKDSVLLNGSHSEDPDGVISTYQWTKITGPSSGIIRNAGSVNTVVAALVQGIYQFELSIKDDRGAMDKDTVQITVQTGNGLNQLPVARAGMDQVLILPVNSCSLNGTDSHDPDGTIIAYKWTMLSGPATYVLSKDNEAIANLSALGIGNYIFELRVTDNAGATATDVVQVVVNPASTVNCNTGNRAQIQAGLTQVGALSIARTPAVGAAGNKIAFAGGVSNNNIPTAAVDIFDIASNSWSTAQLSQARAGIATASLGNKIFFAGGSDVSSSVDIVYDNVDIYDATNNTWTVAHLSIARSDISTAVVGSKIFFAGGGFSWWQASSRVDIYDNATNQWSTAELSKKRMYAGAAAVGNKIYFAGGESIVEGYSIIDIYDNATNSWSVSSLRELFGPIAGVAVGGTIFWAGAIWMPPAVSRVEIWNTSNNTVNVECLSFARSFPTAVVRNEQVAFFGWMDGLGVSHRFDVYNTQTKEWVIALVGQAISGPAIISVNNIVYMAGGTTNQNQASNGVYRVNW
jgi:Kelch motif